MAISSAHMRIAPGRQRGRWVSMAGLVAATAVLCALPAIWNGYPLVFGDSNVYIGSWHGSVMPPYYATAVWITSRAVSVSFSLLVQACLTAYVLCRFLQIFGDLRRPLLTCAYVVLVAGANQLPWMASYIMPDVLAGVGIACLLILFFSPTSLSRAEKWFIFALAVICAVVATANVLMFVALCLGYLAYACTSARRRSVHRNNILQAVIYVIVVLFLSLLPNKVKVDRWTLNMASGALAFSFLVDEGIAQDYLRENCPRVSPRLCDLLPELEKIGGEQGFLWGGLADEHSAWADPDGEFARVSRKIMLDRLDELLAVMFGRTVVLLCRVSLADPDTSSLISYGADDSPVRSVILSELPAERAQFLGALQQKGKIAEHYPERFYLVTTYLGYVLLIGFLLMASRIGDRTSVMLTTATLAFIAIGLAVHGGLVGPFPRYHAKLAWVAWLVLAVVFHRTCVTSFRPAGKGRQGDN